MLKYKITDKVKVTAGKDKGRDGVVEKIVKGILLYRLGSIIPYPIKLTVEKKKKAEAIILNDLEKEHPSL